MRFSRPFTPEATGRIVREVIHRGDPHVSTAFVHLAMFQTQPDFSTRVEKSIAITAETTAEGKIARRDESR